MMGEEGEGSKKKGQWRNNDEGGVINLQ